MQRTKCFFDIHIDGIPKGRIICQLFNDIVPKTCQNFMQLCQGTNKLGPTTGKMMTYKGCTVHRIKDGKIIETGDFSHNDGTGGESIHGGMFEDENFNVSHVQSFLLTMINQGEPNTNGSQFGFTIFGEPLLDGKNVAFGMVLQGKYILDEIRKISVDKNSKPIADIVIMDCGLLNKNKNKEEGELTTSSSSNEVVIEKVTKRRRSSSVEILENENDIKKRRRLAAANMPKFCERENPLYRKSSERPRNELFPERHNQQSDFGRRRRFREDDSPPRNQNHSKNKAEKKVKGRGTARYEPYSSSNIPTPSYWKAEKQRIIPMKDAKDLILRKQEETKALFSEMTDQTERKNLFPIYHPEHVEARKMLQKEAETAEKAAEQERYFGYENSYDNLGSGSSTTSSRFHHSNQETSTTPRYDLPYGFYPTPINLSTNENKNAKNNNFGVASNDIVTAIKNTHIPLPPSPYSSSTNNVMTGDRDIYFQYPPPPAPTQPSPSQHHPQFAYKKPRQFFF